LVNRSDTKSKTQVFKQAKQRLDSGLSICIFPEGLVPTDESVVLHSFKRGAFKLAIEHQIPIVPMTFYDCKKRFSYTFFSGGPGFLRVKIHEFIETKGLDLNEITPLKNSTYELLYEDLIADQRAI
jgi:1-acyl-sn-glycerol-3-phosphate acyltransferase